MRAQSVCGCAGAGLHVTGGYHDGVGGHAWRNAGTATLGGGRGAAAITCNGLGLHAVLGDISISSRPRIRQLGLIGTVSLRSFDNIRRLLVLQCGLGGLRRDRLRLLERAGLRANQRRIGHRPSIEMPGHQRNRPERNIWPDFKRQRQGRRHKSANQAGHTQCPTITKSIIAGPFVVKFMSDISR